MRSNKNIIRHLAALLPWIICRADSAFACSFPDVRAATAESIATSNYYLIASFLLGGLVILIQFYRKRWFSPILPITAVLLIFHPRWTVTPAYGPDCAFQYVEASQLVLAAICLLLGYQIFRMRKRGRTTMTEPRIHSPRTVLFEPQKVADGQWTIRAQTPAGKILYIDRFASEVDAEAWIASSRRDVWLIEQGIVR